MKPAPELTPGAERGAGEHGTDLALVDVRTGRQRTLTRAKDVWFNNVDSRRRIVAYERLGKPGFTMKKLGGEEGVHVERGTVPHLANDRALP